MNDNANNAIKVMKNAGYSENSVKLCHMLDMVEGRHIEDLSKLCGLNYEYMHFFTITISKDFKIELDTFLTISKDDAAQRIIDGRGIDEIKSMKLRAHHQCPSLSPSVYMYKTDFEMDRDLMETYLESMCESPLETMKKLKECVVY